MSRLFLLVTSFIFCGVSLTGVSPMCAQEKSTGNAKSAVQEKLTTGPEDTLEKVAPGKIDADASADFITTESGLKYRILRKSDQAKPSADDEVTVHYKGWLSSNQKIFDSSYRRGESISFPLSGVIKGWTEGMQLVGEGGMIELVIPGDLAYGKRGAAGGKIPPDAELTFIVELLDIK
jgi:FKBP-type peptidyl-prolyl cis-trans isomerase FkpA